MSKIEFKQSDFSPAEIKEVVEIHRKELSEAFLSQLKGRLLEHLYAFVVTDPSSFLIIAKDNNKVVGYIAGTAKIGGFYKRFVKKKFLQAIISLLPNFLSFRVLKGLFETLFYPTKAELSNLPEAEIISFTVRKEYRGTGLAHKLFDEAMTCFKQMGVNSLTIVTGITQISAQKFYEKKGSKRIGFLEVHKGKKSVIYLYKIS
jgi:ribosomal protein S18 acetylase RimI-like enzyme